MSLFFPSLLSFKSDLCPVCAALQGCLIKQMLIEIQRGYMNPHLLVLFGFYTVHMSKEARFEISENI